MVRFPESRNQIEDLSANLPRHTGLHQLQQQAVSVGGLDIGSMDFDPMRHLAHQIDPLSVMQDISGMDQVRIQLPSNPLLVTIVGDYRFGSDAKEIKKMKTEATDSIINGLVEIIPSLDPTDTYKLEGIGTEESDERELLELCGEGLCIVISDFKKLSFKKSFSDRADVLALKLNHPAEMGVVPNRGTISLGGLYELDTNNPAQVKAANALLEKRHHERMTRLHNAGARAGSALIRPESVDIIDCKAVDKSIATMLKSIRR